MERITKRAKNGKGYLADFYTIQSTEEGLQGEAIEKLARFENFYESLMGKYEFIPEEMDKLKREGKTSTLRFKELLARKINFSSILALLRENGLE